ncbi:glycosyltransferase involved in cell wall biosynthesis [Sphingobium fontiphilum]|uniref:Glycosyltransferase involved in cell wall biosynthesis n=1 Tax=Sphingobium fontiphilum TaxID=944425 RepID=A0A7W6DMB1_9SPHN|nr:glycosyltransferase family 1 protein [Sphingobium fontiphilum]MBB3981614.1 glycosyltransferase involved in cell wall biosynthesis [Sphingobium fontiphilum]
MRKARALFNRLRGRYRSAGVSVSAEVYRLISAGNAARSAEQWAKAARHYQAALEIQPSLTHIWIQLGHMLKEERRLDEAMAAYARAEENDPTASEAAVHQGHVAKLMKDGAAATAHFLRAYQHGRDDPDALRELLELLERGDSRLSDQLLAVLKPTAGPAAVSAAPADIVVEDGVSVVVFDASDLISYFGNARLPTGIQRVQIATITGALENRPKGSVRICCFSDRGDNWREVPVANFLELAGLAVLSGDRRDPEWIDAYMRLKVEVLLAPPLVFPQGAFLVNLGTSWWLQNYFMFVREAKRLHNIRYVPFVHDFIPIMTPEHCIKQLTQDFISWALGVYQHADFFLVNSQATKKDLLKVADILGHQVSPDAVSVIPLNARFGSPDAPRASLEKLHKWKIEPGKFVLFVSTIESRKNHIGALDAWLDMIQRHGAANIPKLVCVGNRGWLNDAVYSRIENSPALRKHVVMLQGLSDEELTLLYRQCRFTLYPSNYEGWGLPVTESLCYGKVPLLSDSSSLPEAGGDFAVYFEAGSTPELIEKAERLIFDDAELARLEAKIATEFRPRGWEDIAAQIVEEVEAFVRRAKAEPGLDEKSDAAQPVELGAWYPITRNYEMRIWRGLAQAEIYRRGTGWWWPDEWGCWTKPNGGELAFRFPDQDGPLRCFLRIHAPAGGVTRFTLTSEDFDLSIAGTMKPDEYRWISFEMPANLPTDGVSIRLQGSHADDLNDRSGGVDKRIIAAGVAGFFFCRADDMMARFNFVEMAALNSLSAIAFNQEALP